VFLLADAAKDVTGQIFAVRMNEIFLMGQSRPLRSVHRSEGWTCETLAAHAMPALKPSFYPLDRSGDVFSWGPVYEKVRTFSNAWIICRRFSSRVETRNLGLSNRLQLSIRKRTELSHKGTVGSVFMTQSRPCSTWVTDSCSRLVRQV